MGRIAWRRFGCVLTAAALLFGMTGCSQNSGEIISYSLSADPGNLDPQTATDIGALMIIDNTMEGLYRKAEDGSFELGLADSVSVSDDGLTLTFTLKQDVPWKYYTKDNQASDGTQITQTVTAQDFVFAFRRLLDPNTHAPFASEYDFIENAKEVREGKKDVSTFGVRADSDTQLTLTLDHTDPFMEERLASAPAMPCNEQFFNATKGRYGTNADMLLSDGPYYVDSWSTDSDNDYVRIRANDLYHDRGSVVASGANFTVRTSDQACEAFANGDIDTALVSANQYQMLSVSDEQTQAFEGSVWGIAFNQEKTAFASGNIRRALALDIDRSALSGLLSSDQTMADGIVPPAVSPGGESYRQTVGGSILPGYDPDTAKSLLAQGLAQMGETSLDDVSVLVCDEAPPVVQQILQGWQKDLGVYLKVDAQPQEEYQKRLKNHDFDCAVVTIASSSNDPGAVLANFSPDSSDNLIGSKLTELPALLASASSQPDISSMAAGYLEAEKDVLDSGSFIPIAYETEYFVQQSGISKLLFDPGSRQLYVMYANKG